MLDLHVRDGIQGAHILLQSIIQINPELDEIGCRRARMLATRQRPEQITLRKLVTHVLVIDLLKVICQLATKRVHATVVIAVAAFEAAEGVAVRGAQVHEQVLAVEVGIVPLLQEAAELDEAQLLQARHTFIECGGQRWVIAIETKIQLPNSLPIIL